MQKMGDFKLPHFFNYPPYFTEQTPKAKQFDFFSFSTAASAVSSPPASTGRRRWHPQQQVALGSRPSTPPSPLLSSPIFPNNFLQPVKETREKQVQLWKALIVDYCRTQNVFLIGLEEDFPLFTNPVIQRSLSHEAREAFVSALVLEGRAEWTDKNHRKCLILWHRIQEWAELIVHFVKENGLEDSVMTVEEIRSGIESRGTELHGIDRTVLMRALKLLENKGKLAIFKGTSTDDEGIKFSV